MTHTKEPQRPDPPDTGVIRAQVDHRLLAKADRLFTGTTEGRMIELLQNARRAGATKVRISVDDGWITTMGAASGTSGNC